MQAVEAGRPPNYRSIRARLTEIYGEDRVRERRDRITNAMARWYIISSFRPFPVVSQSCLWVRANRGIFPGLHAVTGTSEIGVVLTGPVHVARLAC